MKKSIVFVIGCMVLSFGLSTFLSCDPNRGEDRVYEIPEDDGPENLDEEN